MPDRNYAAMSAEEARADFERYVASGPERLKWLREKSGLALEPSRAALVEAWEWFLRWAEAGGIEEPMEELPVWYEPDSAADGPPLQWDDPRAADWEDPAPLSPPALLVADALSYLYVEALRDAIPDVDYRLDTHRRSAGFQRPAISSDAPGFVGREAPMSVIICKQAIAPGNEWERTTSRDPEALARLYDGAVERFRAAEAAGGPGPRTRPPATGAELLERHDEHALWSVDAYDDADGPDGLQVSFDDEVAHVASEAIDGLVEDLRAAQLPGVARVVRPDRDIVAVEPGDARPDRAQVAALVEERMRDRLGALGEL